MACWSCPTWASRPGRGDHQLDVVLIHEQCGVLGLGVKGHRPEKMITGSMPDELADAVESVAVVWANVQPLDGDDVQQFVDFLRSDAHFSWDPGAHARRRLGEVCAS